MGQEGIMGGERGEESPGGPLDSTLEAEVRLRG